MGSADGPGTRRGARAQLERISQPPQQDDEGGEVEEAEVVLGLRLVAGDQAPEAHEPGEEALDVPSTR